MTAHRWVMEAPDQPLVRTEFEPATPGRGEVLVEVAGCGVCHTDLGFYYDGVRTRHPLPLTLGHEISGTVIVAGPGAESLLGNNVIIPAVIPCGECDLCQRDLGTICRNQKSPGIDMHGGFATHVTVPSYGLCEIDMDRLKAAGLTLPDVSVVADAVTTPYQAIMQAGVVEGDLAIIIGVGGVGGYAVQIANALGAAVVAIDIDNAKLDALRDYGAAAVFNAREISGRELRDAIRDFAKQNGLRQTEWKIFECSGTAAGQANAYGLLTFGASLSVVGFTMEKIEVRLANLMAFHARALGNWGCLPRYYPRALDLVLEKKVQMLPFVRQHPLATINEVFAKAHSGQMQQRAILVPA